MAVTVTKRELVFRLRSRRWLGLLGFIAGALGGGSDAESVSLLVPDVDQIGFALLLSPWALWVGACWTRIIRWVGGSWLTERRADSGAKIVCKFG